MKVRKINDKLVLSKAKVIILSFLIFLFILNTFSFTASAAGLVEEYEGNGLMYTRYSYDRYSLDYGSSGWFDFDSVFNGIANCFFFLCNCLGHFTGFLVKEAYSLDFVKDFADEIGSTIQSVAGVTNGGINKGGLFYGFLTLLIVVLGFYVVYNGLIKRASSKVLSAIFNFVIIFVVGVCFIAYSPSLLRNVADFTSDINSTILSAASFAFHNGEDTSSYDDSDLIYENVWNVMVYQPWLLLEFGTTDVEYERVENLLKYEYGSDERAEAADKDIDDYDNDNIKNSSMKLGTTFLMLIVDIVLCLFILLLAGMLILSQFMFLIFCCIIPFIFVFAMFPSMTGKLMRYVMYLFNLLIAKCAITLILTIAFSLSSMFLSLSENTNYIFTAFLQIICFVGVFKYMPKILAMVGIDAGDIMHSGHPSRLKNTVRRGARNLKRHLPGGKRTKSLPAKSSSNRPLRKPSSGSSGKRIREDSKKIANNSSSDKASLGERIGRKTSGISMNNVKNKAGSVKDKIKSAPVNFSHAVHNAPKKAKERFKNGVSNIGRKIGSNYNDFITARGINQSLKNSDSRKKSAEYADKIKNRRNSLNAGKQAKEQKKQVDKLDNERPDIIKRRQQAAQKQKTNSNSRSERKEPIKNSKEHSLQTNNRKKQAQEHKNHSETIDNSRSDIMKRRQQNNTYSRPERNVTSKDTIVLNGQPVKRENIDRPGIKVNTFKRGRNRK